VFSSTADLYDAIYAPIKDYAAETQRIAELLARAAPGARTILDVGCGTGEHARLLAERGYQVDGIDLEPAFVELARRKHPGGRFLQGDMASFDLGRRYDVVMSLFSAIGYVRTLDQVEAALRRFAAHLEPGGVVIVEPWLTPESWQSGRVHVHTATDGGRHIVRMGLSATRGRVSVLTFEYLIGSSEGLERRSEVHELGLFTVEEMLDCFARAGLRAEHDPVGPMGRGLYVATAAERAATP
jgi:SAM-dependent methyltransferase